MNGRPGHDWTVTLVAYANGTLDAAERAGVESALATSEELRRELSEIETMRRAVSLDDAPAAIPAAVFERLGLPPEHSPQSDPPPPQPRPTLVPPPSGAPSALPGTEPIPLPARRPRRARTVLAAAAAGVLVVAGAIAIVGRGSDEPDGEAEPGRDPTDQPSAPSEAVVTSPFEAQPLQALRGTGPAMTAARTAALAVSGEGVATFDGRLVGEPGTEAEVVIAITGDGAVDFGDGEPDTEAYRLAIEFEGVSGPPTALPERTTSETVVVDGRRYNSDNGGPYTEEDARADPGDEGLFADIVLRPDVLTHLPDLADGEIEDLGREQLDGTEVRRLHFDLLPGTLGEADSDSAADVWIDASGVVRKLRVTSSGPLDLGGSEEATLELTMDIDLEDFGSPLEISAPS